MKTLPTEAAETPEVTAGSAPTSPARRPWTVPEVREIPLAESELVHLHGLHPDFSS